VGALAALGATLALLAAPPAAVGPPSLAGVWDGTIGKLPVRVCFNEERFGVSGGYYYRSRLRAIPLQQPDEKSAGFVEGVAEPDSTTPRWTVGKVEAGALTGRWTQGAKSLPIALKRVQMREKETPCASMLFHRPRLEGIRTVSKAALVDNNAGLIRKAGREANLGPRYVDVIRDRAAALFRLPATLSPEALDHRLEAMNPRRSFAELANLTEAARSRDELLGCAQSLHHWVEEVQE